MNDKSQLAQLLYDEIINHLDRIIVLCRVMEKMPEFENHPVDDIGSYLDWFVKLSGCFRTEFRKDVNRPSIHIEIVGQALKSCEELMILRELNSNDLELLLTIMEDIQKLSDKYYNEVQ